MVKGRPSRYKAEYDEQAFNYSLLGATDKEMAHFFCVSESTLNLWKINHPTFSESLKAGKDKADSMVVKSLYKRATGYQQDTEKPMVVSVGQNMGSEVEIVKYTEIVNPDTTAIIFWLKNRQPKKWRDRPEQEENTDQIIAGMKAIADKLTNGN